MLRTRNLVIYKYSIEVTDLVELELPEGAEVLCVQVQFGTPKLWVLVNKSAAPIKRRFAVYGTGHPLFDVPDQQYIDTFQLSGGNLVFHVFELL